MLLGEIARIRVGMVVSRKKAEIDLEVKAEYPMLTLKNIQAEGFFTNEPIENFKFKETIDSEFFTREGQILFRLNHPNTAVLIEKTHEGLLIPSYFAIIEITDPNILPGFVAWYLNTDMVKGELLKSQAGTNIPTTNKQVLEKIKIPELDRSKQRVIAEIQRLYGEECRLFQQLMIERDKLYKTVTRSIIRLIER